MSDCIFAAVNHNYGDSQRTMKNRLKQTKWIKILHSQLIDVLFWPGWSELFPERFAYNRWFYDSSKKRKPLVKDCISKFAYHWQLQFNVSHWTHNIGQHYTCTPILSSIQKVFILQVLYLNSIINIHRATKASSINSNCFWTNSSIC